jgi:hypothetical protein
VKRIISIILLTGFLLQTFSRVIIYLNYELNLDYIIQTYCINKNDPAKHCDGKCHLTKQMQEEEKKESLPGPNRDERPELPLISEKISAYLFNNFSGKEVIYPDLKLLKTVSPVFGFFHPPKVFSPCLNQIV